MWLATSEVFARQWYIEPGIEFSVGYDENPRLTEDSDFETDTVESDTEIVTSTEVPPVSDVTFGEIGGELFLVSESEIDTLSALIGLSATRYSESELDSEAERIQFAYDRRGQRTDVSLALGYSKDSSFETELAETGIDTVGTERTTFSVSPEATYRFTPELRGTAGYEYSEIDFSGEAAGLIDYYEQQVYLELAKLVTERLDVSFRAEYSQYRPDSEDDIETQDENVLRLLVGLTYNLTETLEGSLSVGPVFVDSETSSGPSSDAETSDNGIFEDEDIGFDLGLTYTGLRNNVRSEYSRDQDISPLGGISEADRLSLFWFREQTFGGNLSVELAYSERTESLLFDRVNTFTFSPTFELPLSTSNSVVLEYTYIDQETESLDDDTGVLSTAEASNNRFLISWVHRFRRITVNN